MNNNEFYNANNYYLIDIFNGKKEKNRILFDVVSNSIYNLSNAKEVSIESKIKKIDETTGEFYYETIKNKAFIKKTDNPYSDSLDIINSEIASLLGIPSSKVFELVTDTDLKGVINIDVKKSYEKELKAEKLFKEMINLIKNGTVKMSPWLDNYLNIPKNDSNTLIKDEDIIKVIIDIFPNMVNLFLRLDDKSKKELTKNYIEMIYFDLLSNNTVRNFNTYSILLNKNIYSRMSPIYDYNNEIKPNKYYVLNECFIDKSTILNVLYKYYYEYIKNLSRGLKDNNKTYVESMSLIINAHLEPEYAKTVKNNYLDNIDNIKSLETLHRDNFGENRLDIAMTKTSINLNAINNNQLVHQKYDTYNKEEIEDEDPTVTIKIEPKKKSNNSKKVILFIIGIILLCAIAVGLSYIVMLTFE